MQGWRGVLLKARNYAAVADEAALATAGILSRGVSTKAQGGLVCVARCHPPCQAGKLRPLDFYFRAGGGQGSPSIKKPWLLGERSHAPDAWELMGTHSPFLLLPLSLPGRAGPHLPQERSNCVSSLLRLFVFSGP